MRENRKMRRELTKREKGEENKGISIEDEKIGGLNWDEIQQI